MEELQLQTSRVEDFFGAQKMLQKQEPSSVQILQQWHY